MRDVDICGVETCDKETWTYVGTGTGKGYTVGLCKKHYDWRLVFDGPRLVAVISPMTATRIKVEA